MTIDSEARGTGELSIESAMVEYGYFNPDEFLQFCAYRGIIVRETGIGRMVSSVVLENACGAIQREQVDALAEVLKVITEP